MVILWYYNGIINGGKAKVERPILEDNIEIIRKMGLSILMNQYASHFHRFLI